VEEQQSEEGVEELDQRSEADLPSPDHAHEKKPSHDAGPPRMKEPTRRSYPEP
jgi:hypothetical protein